MYQHFFFITNLRYFVDHDLNFWSGILLQCWSGIFSWLRTRIFKATWFTQIFFGKLMKLMQKWKRYNNKVSSRKELFQLSQNSVRKEKTNYFTGRHPAGFSGNRLRKNNHKKKFIRHINSRNPMVRWIWDFVVRQVTPNHKPPVYHVW